MRDAPTAIKSSDSVSQPAKNCQQLKPGRSRTPTSREQYELEARDDFYYEDEELERRRPGVQLAANLASIFIPAAVFSLTLKWAMKRMDPNYAAEKRGKARSKQLSNRLGRKVELEGLELVLAQEIVFPEQIKVTLADIGGLDGVAAEIQAKVLLPLQRPQMFSSSLIRLERGVLLYGRPGTGKTMLAQAVAAQGKATFLRISASSLLSKWFGETAKLASALFSLARKIAPCVIFIDEADALLGRRREGEHEMMTGLKTEILQLWDGLLSGTGAPVMVLGATNRPYDLDVAVLRRFSLQLEVAMPGERQREEIIAIHLRKHMAETGRSALDADIRQNVDMVDPSLAKSQSGTGAMIEGSGGNGLPMRPLLDIARRAGGFSGSDLHQLCSTAASIPYVESTQFHTASFDFDKEPEKPRPISRKDLLNALTALQQSRNSLVKMEVDAGQTERERHDRHHPGPDSGVTEMATAIAAAIAAAFSPPPADTSSPSKSEAN